MPQRVLDVVDPDEAPVAVVGVAEGAPRAGGAADIGQEVVDALVEHPSGDVVVARSGLALRPPVEVDDGRSRAGPRFGAVQPSAQPETVAGGVVTQFRRWAWTVSRPTDQPMTARYVCDL